jgi:hypothetical protein
MRHKTVLNKRFKLKNGMKESSFQKKTKISFKNEKKEVSTETET